MVETTQKSDRPQALHTYTYTYLTVQKKKVQYSALACSHSHTHTDSCKETPVLSIFHLTLETHPKKGKLFYSFTVWNWQRFFLRHSR